MVKKFKYVEDADKPRERLIKKGPASLKDKDLLMILLGSGVKGADINEVSTTLLKKLRENNYELNLEQLKSIKGIGEAKALQILAALELKKRFSGLSGETRIEDMTPKNVWECLGDIRVDKREHFVVFFLDSRTKEIERHIVSIGILNASMVHPREVFEKAIEKKAASIICAHNHPSGSLDPSDADISITERLVEAGKILGIEFEDHVIVTRDGFLSIKDDYDKNLFY